MIALGDYYAHVLCVAADDSVVTWECMLPDCPARGDFPGEWATFADMLGIIRGHWAEHHCRVIVPGRLTP